jgi:hypothetical protein
MPCKRRERRDRYAPSWCPTNQSSCRQQGDDDCRHDRCRPLGKEEGHQRHSRLHRSCCCFTRMMHPMRRWNLETSNRLYLRSPTLLRVSGKYKPIHRGPRRSAPCADRMASSSSLGHAGQGRSRAQRGDAPASALRRMPERTISAFPRVLSLKCSDRSADDRESRRSYRRGEYRRPTCRDCARAQGATAPA